MAGNAFSNRKAMIKNLMFLALAALFLSGCAQLIRTEQPAVVDWETLAAGQTIGQTFVAKYDGLVGIYFYLAPLQTGNGEIKLHLRLAPQDMQDLAVSVNTLQVDSVKTPGYYGFYVSAQAASNQKYYYAFLESTGSGAVQVGKAAGDAYLNGASYQNGTPEDAQTAFQLSYSRREAFLGLAWELVTWGGIVAIGFFLFILPGWGLFSLLWPGWRERAWPEKLGLSAGLSLALYPLLLLWTDIIGLHLGVIYAWLPPLAGLGMILWRNRSRLSKDALKQVALPKFNRASLSILPDITLLIVLALIIFTRFWAIRSLEAPMWADSVQHTVMAQLMLDNGGLFKSWLPYAPYNSLTYQFGFPTFAAVFAWLTGLGSLKATLIVAQIINGLAVLTLYPLAVRIAKGNRWAGIGALLVAGLLSSLPAYYVNWGRFSQLAGQAVLPVAVWLAWEALAASNPSSTRKRIDKKGVVVIVFAALALVGMMLSSYRLPYFYPTYILALLVGWSLPEWRLNGQIWARKLGILLVIAVLAAFLFLPWMLRLVGSVLAGEVGAAAISGSTIKSVLVEFQAWGGLFSYVPIALAAIVLAALVWNLVRKNWMVAAQGLWVVILALVVAGGLIHLPGASWMHTFAILIALYIPVGLVVGWLISEIAGDGKVGRRQSLVAVAVCVAAIFGTVSQRNIPLPDTYAYVTRPDALAMTWIRENLREDAHFLVEGAMYQNTSIIGSDAGWWLPLMAGRQNSMPPQYALNETPIQTGYTQRMIALVDQLQTISPGSPQGVALICSDGFNYVYIGQQQGKAALKFLGSPQLFSPDVLISSQDYRLLYHQDLVYVFALKTDVCP